MNKELNTTLTPEAVELLNQLALSITKTNLQPIEHLTISELYNRDVRVNQGMFSASHLEVIKAATNHLLKYFGDIPLNKLMTKQNILAYRIYYLKTLKNKTYWKTLQGMFARALELGLIEVNHFANINLPKEQQKEPIVILPEELERILDNLKQPYKDFILFLVNTGLRIGEFVRLKYSDLNLAEDSIVIGKSFVTKNRMVRTVPLNYTAKRILGNILPKIVNINQKEKYVFGKKNGYRYTTDRISKVFKKACRDAKVRESIHLHSLRATFCSNLLKSGCTLYKASLILGHSNIETTRKFYSSIDIRTLKDAVNLLNK